jgi:lipopolysaccharide transport system permease protein
MRITIIEKSKGGSFPEFKKLREYKDLFYYLVLRDVTVLYKQTILGFAWAVINPLFQIVIFSFVFGRLAGIKPGIDNMPYPLFSALAVIPWTYFSASLSTASNSLISSSSIFTKVYFPRVMIPLTPIVSKLFDFFVALSIICIMMFYYGYAPGSNIVLVLWPLLIIIISSAGLGLWLSALSLQYRDVRFALGFILPILLYLAPVAFPASLIKEKIGTTLYHLYALYPMAGGIEGFRASFTHGNFPFDLVIISSLSAIVIFITGLYYFRNMEKHFADVA